MIRWAKGPQDAVGHSKLFAHRLKGPYMLNKMKIMLVASAAAASLFSGTAQAQVSDSEPVAVTAEILVPVAITVDAPMNFGLIASSGNAGTVQLPLGSNTRICSAEVTCVGTGARRGEFHVSAATDDALIDLSVDPSVTLTGPVPVGGGTAPTMVATLALSDNQIVYDAAAAEAIFVGGTLNVGAAQAAGVYTGSFNVTAEYN